MSGPVTSVARVEDVQIFLKDPVYGLPCGNGSWRIEINQEIYNKFKSPDMVTVLK